MNETKKKFGVITAKMRVENGMFIVLKGSKCAPSNAPWMPDSRKAAVIENDTLMEDIECNSPSTAGWVPLGHANNGWLVWKTEDGQPINIFRQKKDNE